MYQAIVIIAYILTFVAAYVASSETENNALIIWMYVLNACFGMAVVLVMHLNPHLILLAMAITYATMFLFHWIQTKLNGD